MESLKQQEVAPLVPSQSNLKPQYKPRLRLPSFADELLRTIIFVVIVTVLFDMAIPRSLVDGRSMEPTFEDGQRLIVSRLHYLFTLPQRGDVIVFNSVQASEGDIMLIKRVIGVPGDIIEFRDQELYVNGERVDEQYIKEACTDYRCPDETWELGENEYFVMGDNRNNSQDSRRFGTVPLEHIVGRVVFRYWPIERIGLVTE